MADKYDSLKEEYNVGQNKKKDVIDQLLDQIDFHGMTAEPVIIPKHEKRTPLFNDQIISMYSFGM